MRGSKLLGILFVLGAGVLLTPTLLFAETTLFSDNFESQSPVSTIAYPDYRTDCAPNSAAVGTWGSSIAGYPQSVQVTNYAAPGTPFGSQYLRMGNTESQGQYAMAGFALQNTAGDLIHAESQVQLSSTDNFETFYILRNDSGAVVELVSKPDGLYSIDSTGSLVDTGLDYAVGTWQKWQIDYKIGAGAYKLTVGNASATLSAWHPGGVNALQFTGYAAGQQYYVDNVLVTNGLPVPEPSTMAMGVAGLVGLLAYAWRKR